VAKPLIAVVLVALLAGAVALALQERRPRQASEDAHRILAQAIAEGQSQTDKDVHQLLGREPDAAGPLDKHRWREEYRWSGNFHTHMLYAYYSTAAVRLLTAVSLNQEHPDWKVEGGP
jgi:hypothetical protein